MIKQYYNKPYVQNKNSPFILPKIQKNFIKDNRQLVIENKIPQRTKPKEQEEKEKEKEEKAKLLVKLPFLNNVKSRYKDYNDINYKKLLINRSLNEIEYKSDPSKKISLSKLKLKKIKPREQKYFYNILPGNNSKLVEKCLLTRPN